MEHPGEHNDVEYDELMNAKSTKEEPTMAFVKLLAREGLNIGHNRNKD